MIDIKKSSLYKQLEFDTSLTSIFQIYLKQFWPLFIISFMGLFLIQMILYHLGFFELYKIENQDEMLYAISKLMGKMSIVSIAYVIVYGLLNAVLVNYILRKDIDPTISFGEIFNQTIKNSAIHMIFFMILSIIMIILSMIVGVVVFIVGIFLAAFYIGAVLMPGGTIIVAEEKNAIESIGRTFSMVHKDFWNSLGIFVVFILIMILLGLIINALISIPFVVMFFDNLSEGKSFFDSFNIHNYELGMWIVVLNSAVSALVYPLYSALSVVMYFRLRYQEDQINKIE